MSGRAAIHACSLVLAHAPGPRPARLEAGARARGRRRRPPRLAHRRASGATTTRSPTRRTRRSIGNLRPEALWDVARPWWSNPVEPRARGAVRRHRRRGRALPAHGGGRQLRPLQARREPGAERRAHDRRRASASPARWRAPTTSTRASPPSVLLENLACKATGALALEHLLRATGLRRPRTCPYVIGCGEEAVGDRYQRGGGNLAKAIAEQAGCVNASGSDVKAFCCGPVHALVVAGSLVAAGVYPHVVVVAGGSLAKLGMKFSGALRHGVPDPRGRARRASPFSSAPPGDGAPELRLDAVGRHRVGSGLRPAGRARGSRRRAARSASAAGSSTSTATRPSCTTPRSPSRPGRATSPAATTS